MERENKLAKNTLIIFLGTFYSKLAQYFLLPLYTRVLTTGEYGTVELFNTLVLLFAPLMSMQLEQGAFRYLVEYKNDKDKKKEIISTTVISLMAIFGVCAALMALISLVAHLNYGWLLLLGTGFTCLSTLLMQIMRGLGNNKSYSISNIIIATGTIVFNVVFLLGLNLKSEGMIYGSIIGNALRALYLCTKMHIFKEVSISAFSWKQLKKLLKYSLPMLPNALSWWIFSSSDRVIVSSILGVSENGVLSIAYKFSSLVIVLYNVFHMSFTESVISAYKDLDFKEYFNKIFTVISQFFVTICGVMMAFMPIVFRLTINKSFEDSYNLISIAMLASIFQVMAGLLATLYIAHSKTKSIAITSILSAIINVVLDLILINIVGVYAAVISTLASFLFLFTYRLIDSRKRFFKIRMDKRLLTNLVIVLTIIIPLSYINNIYVILFNIFISICAALIFNGRNTKTLLSSIKRKSS